ncbi:Na+/H+ antiporter subunit E [Tessaracoccus sp. HDW20]|uniref:Na+/H+ antiporter subunit E n=1 Tax=Tessaracoccus coleopterorum TaxID=2714950 RepID=UPI0018D403A4|nr:Na+/H+ antiporter subunit E [Tessaracoccus coleopterorum]NHB84814.1 Na+/H+ antiporter subunit E [Tessaracoccus coleopterorum]
MTIASGALLGWLVSVVFPLPPIHWEGRFHPIGFFKLVWHLLHDLVLSSFRMIQLAFQCRINLNAGIVRVDLDSNDDLYQVQVAELISLVPGTVVVEVVRHPRRLYLHALDLVGPDPVGRIQKMTHDVEARVLNAFGSAQEIADYRAARARGEVGAEELPELEVDES